MIQLLDLDLEAHRTIIEQLPVQHLSALSCTCRHFRTCILEGSFAEKLWRDKCREEIGQGLLSLHLAGVPHGLPPTAQYWRHLCYHAEFLNHVRWWKDGTETIELRAQEADLRSLHEGEEPGPPMSSRLARSGHSVAVIGHLLVVSGGILRDISLYVDIVIMDLNTLAFIKPQVYGEVPMTRFRHTGVVVAAEPTSRIGTLVNQVLHPLHLNVKEGSVVLLYGGYNTMGQEFGGDQFEAFWVSHDGSVAAWVPIKTIGHAPSARFHHTTTSFDGGKQLILYGGEGHEMIDGADNQPPNVYTLDMNSLTWHRRSTNCNSPEHSPGVRSLHIATVRQCPQTGHEELIVLAGYCNNALAAMNPYRLDLTTWQWVGESGLVPNPGCGDALALPIPRQRAAAERVGNRWLLLLGGSPTQFLQGNFLGDLHKLNLPTLTWRLPPTIHGRPARALRSIAGHSLDGLIAFGGCIPTIMGIMPVAKTDPLLLGPPPGLDMFLEQAPTANANSSILFQNAVPEANGNQPVLIQHQPLPAERMNGSAQGRAVGQQMLSTEQSEGSHQEGSVRRRLLSTDKYLASVRQLASSEDGRRRPVENPVPPLYEQTSSSSWSRHDRVPAGAPGAGGNPFFTPGEQDNGIGFVHAASLRHEQGGDGSRPNSSQRELPSAEQADSSEQAASARSHIAPMDDGKSIGQASSSLRQMPYVDSDLASVQGQASSAGPWRTPVQFEEDSMPANGAGKNVTDIGPIQPQLQQSEQRITSNRSDHVQGPLPGQEESKGKGPLHEVEGEEVGIQAELQVNPGPPLVGFGDGQNVAWRSSMTAHELARGETHLSNLWKNEHLVIGAEEASGSNPAAAQPCQVNETVISDGTRYGRFTAWRVPGAIASHEAPADPALPANFWRHEATGEFYTRQKNGYNQLVMTPLQGTSSESSDSVGSPVVGFQPDQDLNQVPPPPQAQNQGPCLMQ